MIHQPTKDTRVMYKILINIYLYGTKKKTKKPMVATIVNEFLDVFLEDHLWLSPFREIEFIINIILKPVSKVPYIDIIIKTF